jgi:hypothetical protein
LPNVYKTPFNLQPEDGFMKAETCSCCVILINYIVYNKVVVNCNIDKFLLMFEYTTGMSHLNKKTIQNVAQGALTRYRVLDRDYLYFYAVFRLQGWSKITGIISLHPLPHSLLLVPLNPVTRH